MRIIIMMRMVTQIVKDKDARTRKTTTIIAVERLYCTITTARERYTTRSGPDSAKFRSFTKPDQGSLIEEPKPGIGFRFSNFRTQNGSFGDVEFKASGIKDLGFRASRLWRIQKVESPTKMESDALRTGMYRRERDLLASHPARDSCQRTSIKIRSPT